MSEQTPAIGQSLRRRVVASLGVPVMMASILGGMAILWFGSLSAALAYVNGYVLDVNPGKADLGTVRAGSQQEVTFSLRNLTGSEVKVIGYNTVGFCRNTTNIPVAIGAGQEIEATFLLLPPRRLAGAQLDVLITLYLDVPGRPAVLQVTGSVVTEMIGVH